MKNRFQLTSFCGLLSGLALLVGVLVGGSARAENALEVGSATVKSGETAEIPLLMSSDGDVQGFVLVMEWESSNAKGVEVLANDGAGKPLNGADLIQSRVEDGYVILASVLDIDGKDGEKIPAGSGTVIGTAKIRCDGPSSGTEEVSLKLVDDKHARVDGGPNLSNILSIGGLSIGKGEGLKLKNGTLTCEGEGEPTPTAKLTFAVGGTLSSSGNPRTITAGQGTTTKVHFYYKAGSKDRIQGLSMALAYSCDLAAYEDSLDITDGVLADADPEFLHLEVDNKATNKDKDGCELTVGILIDAKSPFDGRTLPTTNSYKELFSLDFRVEDQADCGKCYSLKFIDGLNGNGSTPVSNVASIGFLSKRPSLKSGQICVDGSKSGKFVRGDCNMSSSGNVAVDIADAAAMVGYFFLKGDKKFAAPCDDACDANDDGRLDASDVVYILNYLFVPKSPKPPSPGPTSAGSDPTNDKLSCEGGGDSNDC